MSQLQEEIKSKLDLYIDDMDKVLDDGDLLRQELIQDMMKLKRQMMDPDAHIDPEFHMARLATFGELRQAINDRDKARIVKVNIQMKKKSEESNANIGKVAIEALKQFTTLGANEMMNRNAGTIIVPDDEEVERQLNETFADHGIQIRDTELRDDYRDLSENEEEKQ
jgi:cell division protein FtsL